MSIFIDNTLTGKKEEFIPLNPPLVKMYVCGPTVYDEPHIGHARSAYIFDVIRRYLQYRGHKVTFVRNVTDVDDKIINKAKEKYPNENLNDAVKKVSEEYLKAYHDDMKQLGILEPDVEPKATEYISKMQDFITNLINRGVAYVSEGDVYFDIKKAKNYGKLSHQSLEEMEVGARIAPGEKKKDPLDFALWKAAKEGEPSWESPWGKGRPGWHIECSVMSSAELGDEFDIHGGGLDLKFPHHENEIAQSEGAGKKFAKYWIHHGLLSINGQKMSKSLGNFVTIKDFLAKYRDADLLKIFFLSTHYSHPIDYNEQIINDIRRSLERIYNFRYRIENKFSSFKDYKATAKEFNEIKQRKEKFINAMDDDFNMPQALAALNGLIILANVNIENIDFVYEAVKLLNEQAKTLGLDLNKTSVVKSMHVDIRFTSIEKLVEERNEARKRGDYKEADRIRKKLEEEAGIILEDEKDGKTTWRKRI